MPNIRIFAVIGSVFLSIAFALGQTAGTVAQPGAVIIEPPTTGALGIEWHIEGDSNRNATVAVQFRPVGESKWRDALSLVRIGGENVQQGSVVSLCRAEHVCRQRLRTGS